MTVNGLLALVARVETLEKDVSAIQKRVARMLWLARESAELSLRDVAPHVDLTAAGLSNIENGKSWKTRTIKRVAQFYANHRAA